MLLLRCLWMKFVRYVGSVMYVCMWYLWSICGVEDMYLLFVWMNGISKNKLKRGIRSFCLVLHLTKKTHLVIRKAALPSGMVKTLGKVYTFAECLAGHSAEILCMRVHWCCLCSVCPRTRHKSYGRWQLVLYLSSASVSGTRYRNYARGQLVLSLPSTSEPGIRQRCYHRRLPPSRRLYFVGLPPSQWLYFVEWPIENTRQRGFFQRRIHREIFVECDTW
jgi:hypothetical protein